MSTNIERYVSARLRGCGHRKASKVAGYSSGAPQEAIATFRFAQVARFEPDAVKWIEAELESVEAKARELSDHLATLRMKLRAAKVMS